MKKFWGYITNGEYSVGCSGQTVYLYDKDNNEIKKMKDMIYAYIPMFSPDGKSFVVKSTDGCIAIYSLETYTLIKKLRYTKFGDDWGFCFDPKGKFFLNIGCGEDALSSAIYVYNTKDFSLINQINIDRKMMLCHIEYDDKENSPYILGFVRGEKDVFENGFVAKFENEQITDALLITKEDFEFFNSYKSLELSGFSEKKYQWSYINYPLEKLKGMDCTLAKLYKSYKN